MQSTSRSPRRLAAASCTPRRIFDLSIEGFRIKTGQCDARGQTERGMVGMSRKILLALGVLSLIAVFAADRHLRPAVTAQPGAGQPGFAEQLVPKAVRNRVAADALRRTADDTAHPGDRAELLLQADDLLKEAPLAQRRENLEHLTATCGDSARTAEAYRRLIELHLGSAPPRAPEAEVRGLLDLVGRFGVGEWPRQVPLKLLKDEAKRLEGPYPDLAERLEKAAGADR